MMLRKPAILALIALTTLVSACGEKENPLAKADQAQISAIVYKNKNADIVSCARQWASKEGVEEKDAEKCAGAAQTVSDLLKKNGYEDVTAADVPFPPLWQAFSAYVKQEEDKKTPSQKMKDAFTW